MLKTVPCALLLSALLPQVASAQNNAVVILSNFSTSTTSDIPNLPGFQYQVFDRPFVSPDGEHWILNGESNHSSGENDLVIVDGTVVLREDTTPSFLVTGDAINSFDTRVEINNAGEYCVVLNSNAAANENDFVVRGESNGAFTVIAREGSPITGLPGLTHGPLSSAVLAASGTVGCESDQVSGTPGGTLDDNLLLLGSTVLAQNGTTIPTGPLNAGMAPWSTFNFADYWISADGSSYIVQGNLDAAGGMVNVVAVDGAVVIREDFAIPGGPSDLVDSSGIHNVFMSHSGDWMANGDFDGSDQGWVVYNGDVVALRDEPIYEGATENWTSIVFTVATCNGVGDFLVGGLTDGTDPISNRAVVLNNEHVVVREGDPIDFDGNGLFDDDLFFDFLETNSFCLTDDLQVYFVATLRNGSSTSTVGEVFVTMDLSSLGIGESYCEATTPNSTGQLGTLAASGSAVASDNNFTLVASNLPDGQFGFFVASRTQGFIANPNSSQGNLCMLGNIARFRDPGQLGMIMNGAFSRQLPLDDFPEPPSFMVQVMAGDTWNFQLWHRDTVPGVGPTSNFTGGLEVLFE